MIWNLLLCIFPTIYGLPNPAHTCLEECNNSKAIELNGFLCFDPNAPIVVGNYKIQPKYSNPKIHFHSYENTTLFCSRPSILDVMQGHIKNCYFIQVLAAIAHSDPDFVVQNIHSHTVNQFDVTFYQYNYFGYEREFIVKVDDAIAPVNYALPLTAIPKNCNGSWIIWPLIYEKAYVLFLQKLNDPVFHQKGYDHFSHGGNMRIAIYHLTGQWFSYAYTKSINDNLLKSIWVRGGQWNSGCPVLATTPEIFDETQKLVINRVLKREKVPSDCLRSWHVFPVVGFSDIVHVHCDLFGISVLMHLIEFKTIFTSIAFKNSTLCLPSIHS
jgi:hypothetical protein